jgi:hypothetical protein
MEHISVSTLSNKINKCLREVSGPQIRKFADFNFFRFSELPQLWQFGIWDLRTIYFLRFADSRLADTIIFCGLNTSTNLQIHKFLTDISLRSLKYTYVGKKKVLEANQCGSESQTMFFFLATFRICDLRTKTPRKFADLRSADWHTTEIFE